MASVAPFPLPLPLAIRWALLIALAKSTQYLLQPFVWANWPWQDVVAGWMVVARDDVVVSSAVAVAIVAASRVRVESAVVYTAVLGLSIAGGAIAGELALCALDGSWTPRELQYHAAHAVYWIVLAGCIVTLYHVWRGNAAAAAVLQAHELRVVALQRATVRAQLQALRNQIEPHFLFNTLATLKRLREAAPEKGALLLRDFLDFLRLSISPHGAARNTVGKEVALARAYLGIVAVRMSGRLEVRFDCDDAPVSAEFPALTLGTLVENAVKHGIGPKPEGGIIIVQVRRIGDDIEAQVTDSGVGFTGRHGTGIGLVNIRTRLRIQYGDRGRLELSNVHPSGVRATIRIPCVPVMGAA